ncbi:MAG: putative baseplate assembly protein [Chitinophagaceae bacterium]|nr:putative baseplate assembly protein [Chitinophagaceae bacterium]
MPELCSCGCCEGVSPETPLQISNRPGLSAIAYRVGTYHEFRDSLLAALSDADLPALRALTTRSDDDPTIALLDAWAVVSDVLTFYQERIANESYLRTATERYSILQMARLIGYELRPGVAASTYLAFTLDKSPVAPLTIPGSTLTPLTPALVLDAGIKVQSVPGTGEQAQTFETIEKIEARPEWNVIRPRLQVPQPVKLKYGMFIFNGVTNDLKKGDVLLGVTKEKFFMRSVLSVQIDAVGKTTTVYIDDSISLPGFSDKPSLPNGDVGTLLNKDVLDDTVLSNIVSHTWKEDDLALVLNTKKWDATDMMNSLQTKLGEKDATSDDGVYVFRKTASPFGYNAPKKVTYNGNIPNPVSKWREWRIKENCKFIYLDSENKEVVRGGFVGVREPGKSLEKAKVFTIEQSNSGSRTQYGLSAKTTLLQVSSKEYSCWFDADISKDDFSAIRGINLMIQSELLDLAGLPIGQVVEGDSIVLDRWYPGLKSGGMMVLTGERVDLKGTTVSEVMELKEVLVEKGYTVVRYTTSLTYSYIRNTVTMNANVAFCTHGETVNEVVGSGDASAPFQRFPLRQPPLTYTSSSAPSGVESTLKMYVNDVLWHEVDVFYGHGPEERIYITRRSNDGKTTVIFGDGVTGARLPSGTENIKAIYRKGIGLGGLVKAGQLSQLLTRPLGVKAAVNPLPAKGAADPENLDDARSNATLTLMTFDRVVSLQDYEDFARAFPGIDKALATWTFHHQKRHIYITVAGTNGALVESGDDLYKNLLKAIRQSGNGPVSIELNSYKPVYFRISANIIVDADYIPEKVLQTVEEQLRSVFSFKARSFGQPVALSEVMTVCQQVKGVVAVDVDGLYYSTDTPGVNNLLIANIPMTGSDKVVAAELLTLDACPVDLKLLS